MLKKLKNIYVKILSIKRIRDIKKSEYFDEEYYLIENFDVYSSGIDAATHFYHYGWRENRRPNPSFNIQAFFEKYPEVRRLNLDPITYILENNLQKEIEDFSKKGKVKVSDLLESFFIEGHPLKTLPVNTREKRMNIIFNGFDKGCFFGGKATALILATQFAQKYNYKLRIIAQDPEKDIFYEFLKLFSIKFDRDIEFYSIESKKYLEVGKEDHFICTMWTTADSVLNTEAIQGEIFYIMQEVETFFYDHGDYHLRCYNTLTNERLIPIVNTKLLYDYYLSHGYRNVEDGVYFEPAFSSKLLSPSEDSFKKKDKYKLFFYGRPSHQRNLFYFGLETLNRAFFEGILDKDEWEVYLAGDKMIPSFRFDDEDVEVYDLGIMEWGDYCDFASKVDLAYSMIYTPHPSYPPFDFVRSGAVVLTNRFANKGDLHMYSKNIISAELKHEAMLDKMKEAVNLAKNPVLRKRNYQGSDINDSWEEAFSEVLPFMQNKIKESRDV
jgi:O-antigen biosynthesis protein